MELAGGNTGSARGVFAPHIEASPSMRPLGRNSSRSFGPISAMIYTLRSCQHTQDDQYFHLSFLSSYDEGPQSACHRVTRIVGTYIVVILACIAPSPWSPCSEMLYLPLLVQQQHVYNFFLLVRNAHFPLIAWHSKTWMVDICVNSGIYTIQCTLPL